jgi:DNA invertase Pin-like site-specific DNA recombinase
MTKITTEHLARNACVYIRQSTADQLAHNHESRRRQYGLVDRAKQLGWSNVEVIDDDLGRSGGGIARPGFERLLATICDGGVGAVLAIEASRLARNGRDWHTLIEFCGLVGTLIVDEDGIYDPRHPNDRLLLGMKGTMSELELSMFRQRSQEALKQKARRGALVLGVAAGYVKIGRDRIEKNPDKRVQDALQLVFTKFAELQSARQVHIWLREERIELPVKSRQGEAHGVVWRLPAYNIVHNILTNPIYAGAYAFGRTTSRVSVKGGRKHVRRGVQKPMAEWDVLIKDHHTAYITWDEFEHKRQFFDFAFGQRNDCPSEFKPHAVAPLISGDVHPPQSPSMTHFDRARYEQAGDTGEAVPNVTPRNQASRKGILEPGVGLLCLFLVRRAKCVRVLL